VVIFYTTVEGLEPRLMCYPYIVCNPWSYSECLQYLSMCRDVVKSIIFDTGVEKLFKRMNLRDYPEWYIKQYVSMVKRIAVQYGRSIEVVYTIPDIPVDYPNRESLYPWNVQRTVEYIELFRDRYIDYLKPALAMPVVQGRKDDIRSVLDTYFRYEHLYNEFPLIGLGPTCSTKNWLLLGRLIVSFDRNVMRPFHSFGAHLKAIEWVLKWKPRNFRSFDSSAYHWIKDENGVHRVKTRKESVESLKRYIERLRGIGVVVD